MTIQRARSISTTSKWEKGQTVPIRVPIALKGEVLQFAHSLDVLPYDAKVLDSEDYQEAIKVLISALSLPPNCGGAIKVKIGEALDLLGYRVPLDLAGYRPYRSCPRTQRRS